MIHNFTLGFLLFCVVYCSLADCPAKNDFWVGKIIFLKLETGDCWDLRGFLLFCVVYCSLADCPAKNDFWVGKIIFLKLETGDCWDLLGFLLFCVVYCCLADCSAKNDFWVGEIIFVKLESGDCWDFFFCGVYTIAGQGVWRLLGFLLGFLLLRCPLLLGRLPGKKRFLGRENHFLKLETSDCLADCPCFFCPLSFSHLLICLCLPESAHDVCP